MQQRSWLVTGFSSRRTWDSVPAFRHDGSRSYTFIHVRIRGAWVDARSVDHPVTNRANDAATALCCKIHRKLSIICDRNPPRFGRVNGQFLVPAGGQLDLQDNGTSCAIFCGVARYPVEIGYWKVRTPQAV